MSELTKYGCQSRITEQRNYPNIQEHADFIMAILNSELTRELANLKVQLENVKTSKAELDKTARQLKDSLESLQQSSSAKGCERMKTNFINTSLKVRANHIAFLCENLNKTIKEVTHELLQIAPNDKETYIIYKNKVYDLLNAWPKDETWSRQARPGGDGQ